MTIEPIESKREIGFGWHTPGLFVAVCHRQANWKAGQLESNAIGAHR